MTNYANDPKNIARIRKEAGRQAALELLGIAIAAIATILGLAALATAIFN